MKKLTAVLLVAVFSLVALNAGDSVAKTTTKHKSHSSRAKGTHAGGHKKSTSTAAPAAQ